MSYLSIPIDHLSLMELDMDARMHEVWGIVDECGGDWGLEQIGTLMRACYSLGYFDALTEPVRATLCVEHGWPVPEQRQ